MTSTTVSKILLSLVLFAIAGLVLFDVRGDLDAGASGRHIAIELLAAALALLGLAMIWIQNSSLRKNLVGANEELERWREENAAHLAGLSAAIDRQLQKWSLTVAETEIALLLLKGLSLKEIADLRKTSERTVRQQTLSIYSKSGLGGRAELSAFFLEDLLAPPEPKKLET